MQPTSGVPVASFGRAINAYELDWDSIIKPAVADFQQDTPPNTVTSTATATAAGGAQSILDDDFAVWQDDKSLGKENSNNNNNIKDH